MRRQYGMPPSYLMAGLVDKFHYDGDLSTLRNVEKTFVCASSQLDKIVKIKHLAYSWLLTVTDDHTGGLNNYDTEIEKKLTTSYQTVSEGTYDPAPPKAGYYHYIKTEIKVDGSGHIVVKVSYKFRDTTTTGIPFGVCCAFGFLMR